MADNFYVDEHSSTGGAGLGLGEFGALKPGWGGGGGSGGNSGNWGSDPKDANNDEWWWLWVGDAPYLKIDWDGALLTDGGPHLLIGEKTCTEMPSVLIFGEGTEAHRHARCMRCELSDPDREFVIVRAPADSTSDFSVAGYIMNAHAGTFQLRARWQGGHYNYALIRRMDFAVYGIRVGFRMVPLGGWADIATIQFTADRAVYVNGVRGDFNGNAAFVEKT